MNLFSHMKIRHIKAARRTLLSPARFSTMLGVIALAISVGVMIDVAIEGPGLTAHRLGQFFGETSHLTKMLALLAAAVVALSGIAVSQLVIYGRRARKVFISYNSHLKTQAAQLAAKLAEKSVRVWLDQNEIRPGDDLDGALANGVADAGAFIVVIERDEWEQTNDSERAYRLEVSRILDEVKRRRVRIIPVLLGGASPPKEIANLKAISIQTPEELAADKTVRELLRGLTSSFETGRRLSSSHN